MFMTRLLKLVPLLSGIATFHLSSAFPLSRRAPAQVFTSCSVPNTVALTFDDGPYIYLNDVVDTLNREGVKGTFFFNGNNFACIYGEDLVEAVKNAHTSGHEIGSHTWGHKRLTNLTFDEVHDEMFRVELALERILGVVPALMRPPFGEFNDLVLEASGIRGQTIVNWDFDSEDGKSATVDAQKALYDAVVALRPPSILSLQHEVHETSVTEVLPYAIQKLKEAGYDFVTVSECLGGIEPYQRVGEPSARDENWQC
ncbi:glycoside hydrolase/deacetylase [Coprinopsis marcescibilis]|uniref:Glycoside hydrolase/deacetylase n=1 Tax=Coprinopsis marcescibilis TaxID=230819 RepID=A0A5C3KCE3_COPMA|nr:glycoside hydrolase/deacetylase [Coprinopsis marcescibilis]